MRCPACDHEVADDAAACAACGAALDVTPFDATVDLDDSAMGKPGPGPGATADLDAAPPSSPASERGFQDMVAGALAGGGWLDAAKAAAVAFLGLLAVGSVLLLALKLQTPALGAGGPPFAAFSGIVILGLASFGTPIHIGELEIFFFPLGAFVFAGWFISQAAAATFKDRPPETLWARARLGAKIGPWLALICAVTALTFRVRRELDPISADGPGALLLGGLWGGVFGALGAVRAQTSVRAFLRERVVALRARAHAAYTGFVSGATMLVVALALGAAGALLWVIAALTRGVPPDLGAGDAVGGMILFAALLPNVVMWVLGVALGAPLLIGAGVTARGRVLGPLRELSLFDWGARGAPGLAWMLLVIPLIACAAGGIAARRAADPGDDPIVVTAAAVGTFAVPLFALAWLAEARLGPGLIARRAFATVAVDPWAALVLASLWAGVVGWAASYLWFRLRPARSTGRG
ncbi:MAG: hypothetical protein ABR575_00105 [Actinomycetota bacterium]